MKLYEETLGQKEIDLVRKTCTCLFAIVNQLKMKDWIIKNIVDDNEVASSHWKTEFVITLDMLWQFSKETFNHLKKLLITPRVSLEVKSNFQNDLLNVPIRRNNLSVSACIPPSVDNFKLNCSTVR